MVTSARVRRLAGLDAAVHVRHGPRRGRPFVLVHGIGVSARYFTPLTVELSRHGTVWAIDLPGHGASPRPPKDPTLADHAAVVAELVASRGLANPVLVGHSMGTQIVTQLVVDNPQLTDRIVLMGTTMPPRLRTLASASAALLLDVSREPLHCNLTVMVDYFFRCGIPYYVRQLPQLLDDAIEERLPDVRAKALVIVGERDPIAGSGWSVEVASRMPHAHVAEVGGAHVVMFSDPVRVAELIVEHAR